MWDIKVFFPIILWRIFDSKHRVGARPSVVKWKHPTQFGKEQVNRQQFGPQSNVGGLMVSRNEAIEFN